MPTQRPDGTHWFTRPELAARSAVARDAMARLVYDEVPVRYRDTRWDHAKAKFPFSWNWRQHWCLLLMGDRGTGKTLSGTVVFMAQARHPSLWIDAGEFIQKVYDSFNQKDVSSPEDLASTCDTLFLDDLGKQPGTPDARTRLATVLRLRYNDLMSTIITTELSLQGIKDWDPAIADRLAGSDVLRVSFTGPSRRPE